LLAYFNKVITSIIDHSLRLQHRVFLDYPHHQQFSAVRFPNPMVKIRLEMRLLQTSPYVLSESTCSPDAWDMISLQMSPCVLSKSTRSPLSMGFGLFLKINPWILNKSTRNPFLCQEMLHMKSIGLKHLQFSPNSFKILYKSLQNSSKLQKYILQRI
jgi:hypothetical protein